jgi:ribosomal protein S18 acetylase RimI-like enzyme
MTQEFETILRPEIVVTIPEDVPALRAMQAAVWNDTYPNSDVGISEEWVKEETASWLTPESLDASIEFLGKVFRNPQHFHRIAKVGDDVVALVHASDEEDDQIFEALYIDSHHRGTGLAQELMAQVLGWLDLTKPTSLEVATYNDRAIAFYRKYGFELVEGSEVMFKEKIPVIKMVRPGSESEI